MTSLPMSPLMGQMMDQPLLISSIIEFAARHYGGSEIVSRRVEGDIHRYTYRECAQRSRRLARALEQLGVRMGDRVGTLAWNGYRHMELYYAVSGCGAVLHTINPRLHPDHLAYIIQHAGNEVLFFDLTFLPLAEIIASRCPSIRHYVLMSDRAHMPQQTGIANQNIAMSHPAVMQAACIGVAHPKWDERPLLVVVRRPGMELTREELLGFFAGKVARFWMPDDVVFVEALPVGGTGKIQKNRLREQFREHVLPTA